MEATTRGSAAPNPLTYLFQVREHFREEHEGSSWHSYGRVLWTESVKAPDSMPLVWRCNEASEVTDRLANDIRDSVALGIVARLSPLRAQGPAGESDVDVFEPVYFSTPCFGGPSITLPESCYRKVVTS